MYSGFNVIKYLKKFNASLFNIKSSNILISDEYGFVFSDFRACRINKQEGNS